jgi:hypothetical protein
LASGDVFAALALQEIAGRILQRRISTARDQKCKVVICERQPALNIQLSIEPAHEIGQGVHNQLPSHPMGTCPKVGSGFGDGGQCFVVSGGEGFARTLAKNTHVARRDKSLHGLVKIRRSGYQEGVRFRVGITKHAIEPRCVARSFGTDGKIKLLRAANDVPRPRSKPALIHH